MSRSVRNRKLYHSTAVDVGNPGHTKKSLRQVRYLLSKGSPLSGAQKNKLKHELHSGAVKIVKKTRK